MIFNLDLGGLSVKTLTHCHISHTQARLIGGTNTTQIKSFSRIRMRAKQVSAKVIIVGVMADRAVVD